ncbi:unnamed protein product [Paramecium sonneborni]|uniref:Leucine Rich Repeat family protein n=1 Tax=Paramecium sonneborni TaxID=65129 RepID=A0A8S1MC85_9CILI|nr:unnamed protein product [Paramecium sonneborni]
MKQLIPSHKTQSLIRITQTVYPKQSPVKGRSNQRNQSLPGFPTQQIDKEDDEETKEINKLVQDQELCSLEQIQDKGRSLLIDNQHQVFDNHLQLIKPNLNNASEQGLRRYYLKSERYKEMQQFYHVDKNIYGRMSEKIQTERLMPRTLKLLADSPDKLVANNIFGSDKYVQLFAEGISSSHFNNLKRLQLRNNKLNNNRTCFLTQRLPSSIIELDFSNNKIGTSGIQSICNYISSRNYNIQHLNLEGNNLKDLAVLTILKTLNDSKSIRVLKLSKNQITDIPMEALGQLLKKNNSLQEVYLHFNLIKNPGGLTIMKGLIKNQFLKVLDLSFNKLGQNQEFVSALSDVLIKPHPELTHLDLSFNRFNDDDAMVIHKALIYNQQLFGFHFSGNPHNYYVNPRSFLVKEVMYDENKSDPKLFKRINSVNCINTKTKENCWICEGWVEIGFHYSGIEYQHPIFLHLDFEQYRPILMNQQTNSYYLQRMCPPNKKIHYYFSNPIYDVRFVAKDQKTLTLDINEEIRKKGIELQYADGSSVLVQLSIVNYIHSEQNGNIIDSTRHYMANITCRPRESESIIDIDLNKAKKRVWSYENSIFKDFQPDTEGHLLDCFEFDFECGKLIKHLQNQQEIDQLKNKMKKIYKYIIGCYHYFCAKTLNYDIPCINLQSFLDFISQTSILEKSLMNSLDLQLAFLSSYVVMKQNNYIHIQEKCLVRFQFVEIIVRLAKEQYIRTGLANNMAEALEMLFEQDEVLQFMQRFGISQDWRDTRYWTELMDYTIRIKMPILNILYENACKQTMKHGNKFVTLADFKLFVDQFELQKYISEKELYLIFLQSMQTQRDELRESKFLKMELLEFIEAITRLAERISPVTPMYAKKHSNLINDVSRRTFPLFVKFEGMIIVMYQKLKSLFIEIPNVEKEIIYKTVIKTEKARKLGIYEEDNSSDEEKIKSIKNLNLLPDEGLLPPGQQSVGWNKLRQWAQKQKRISMESANILEQLERYQVQEDEMFQKQGDAISGYDKYKITQEKKKREEYKKTILYQDPQFKFEQELSN